MKKVLMRVKAAPGKYQTGPYYLTDVPEVDTMKPLMRESKRKLLETVPQELNLISDVVLAYRPKPKSKGAKKRVRKAKKAKADAQ